MKVTILDGNVTYTDSANGKYYIAYKDSVINGKNSIHIVCMDGAVDIGNNAFYIEFTAISDSNNENYKIDTNYYNSFVENFYTSTAGTNITGYSIPIGSAIVKSNSVSFSFTALYLRNTIRIYKPITGSLILQ